MKYWLKTIYLQTRLDFMQLLMNAHKEPTEEKQEDKEHDKEFKEMHKGVNKRCEYQFLFLDTATIWMQSHNS